MTGACLSSKVERVAIKRDPRDVGGLVMRRVDCASQRKESMSIE